MATQPTQKPGRSKQDYSTPQNFIQAAKTRLGITEFTFDFAADVNNTKALRWWSKVDDSLAQSPERWAAHCFNGWGWLNPEFAVIKPWASRCREAKQFGASIALLVPAAVGSNWFRDHVDGHAFVLMLNGRLAFMPDKPKWLYPKDCILALYSPDVVPGYEVWTWHKSNQITRAA